MARSTTRQLFARETLEDGPSFRTIRKLLEVIPQRAVAGIVDERSRSWPK